MHRTKLPAGLFALLGGSVLTACLLCICGCPPARVGSTDEQPAGTYLAASNKLYGDDESFDIRSTVVYPAARGEGLQNPSIGVSDQELAMYRCTWCHECGFEEAWDWEHYGSGPWSPRYVGEEWGPVVQRMMGKENSLLQEEQIARRIYNYLRDDSLGVYDPAADDKGAVVVEVDTLSGEQEEDGSAAEGEPQ